LESRQSMDHFNTARMTATGWRSIHEESALRSRGAANRPSARWGAPIA